MLYTRENKEGYIPLEDLPAILEEGLSYLGPLKNILIVPPDITRIHSFAGKITEIVWNLYRKYVKNILPALGTHTPMNPDQVKYMFGNAPYALFHNHDWRKDVKTIGRVPGDFVEELTESKLNFDWPVQVNQLLLQKKLDLILSIGQVVPHEVAGMAGYNKNILIGTGGAEAIHKSHYISAVAGIENILGRLNNPVRKLLNYASDQFLNNLPILYLLTVVGKNQEGQSCLKGIYMGDTVDCFNAAAKLAATLNITVLEKSLRKVVVYLDPVEFKSTWLGNKSVYRTRLAIADGGELVIIAPGLKEFGEDKMIDQLIRKYGYQKSEKILALTKTNRDLQENLSASAHLIHGSSEERFKVTYSPGVLTKEEIQAVNYRYLAPEEASIRYDIPSLKEGYNILPEEEIYYISNPALGLWIHKDRFNLNK